jgi:rod shape-determining protein MreD
MAALIAFPLLTLLMIFQSSVVSRMPLIHGTADIILLVIIAWALQNRVRTAWIWSIVGGLLVGFISALHFTVPMVSYLLVTGLALTLRRRVWQAPILAMVIVTFVGTLLSHTISTAALIINGVPIPLLESLNQITLPSLILNIIVAVPIFAAIRDLAEWIYPEEIEI